MATDADGHLDLRNQAAADAFRASRGDLMGMPMHELLTPTASRREVQEIAEASIRAAETWTGVLTGQRLDGTTFPHRVTLPPASDDSDEVVGHGRRGPGPDRRGRGVGQGPGQRRALPPGLRREPGRDGAGRRRPAHPAVERRPSSASSATPRRSWRARPSTAVTHPDDVEEDMDGARRLDGRRHVTPPDPEALHLQGRVEQVIGRVTGTRRARRRRRAALRHRHGRGPDRHPRRLRRGPGAEGATGHDAGGHRRGHVGPRPDDHAPVRVGQLRRRAGHPLRRGARHLRRDHRDSSTPTTRHLFLDPTPTWAPSPTASTWSSAWSGRRRDRPGSAARAASSGTRRASRSPCGARWSTSPRSGTSRSAGSRPRSATARRSRRPTTPSSAWTPTAGSASGTPPPSACSAGLSRGDRGPLGVETLVPERPAGALPRGPGIAGRPLLAAGEPLPERWEMNGLHAGRLGRSPSRCRWSPAWTTAARPHPGLRPRHHRPAGPRERDWPSRPSPTRSPGCPTARCCSSALSRGLAQPRRRHGLRRRALHRRRPLQVGQRRARPRGRRPAADLAWPSACAAPSARRTPVARLGGDEFAVVCADLSGVDGCPHGGRADPDRPRRAVPARPDQHLIGVGVSIGDRGGHRPCGSPRTSSCGTPTRPCTGPRRPAAAAWPSPPPPD